MKLAGRKLSASGEFVFRKLGRESQVFEGETVIRAVFPAEQHGHLEGGDVDVVCSNSIGQSDGAVRHVMMPLKFSARMFRLKKMTSITFEQEHL